MQTPGFKGGPKFHKEPDTSWEKFAAKAGLQKQPDGRYKMVREARGGYGENGRRKTENGGRKTEGGGRKTENGRRKAERGG